MRFDHGNSDDTISKQHLFTHFLSRCLTTRSVDTADSSEDSDSDSESDSDNDTINIRNISAVSKWVSRQRPTTTNATAAATATARATGAGKPDGRSNRMTYKLSRTFDSIDAAEQWIRDEKVWSSKQRQTYKYGYKVYYRCNRVRLRDPQCSASLYLLYHQPVTDRSAVVSLYRSLFDHNCDQLSAAAAEPTRASRAIQQPVRDVIDACASKKMKPMDIANHLRMLGMPVPKRFQMYQYLCKAKKEMRTKSLLLAAERSRTTAADGRLETVETVAVSELRTGESLVF